jgi:O-antigen/teichoic acid export membrane protein
VLGAELSGREYRDYSTSSAVGQVAFALGLSLLIAAAAGIMKVTGAPHVGLIVALSPALIAWQFQEFGRRVLYTKGRLRAAVGLDLVCYGTQAVVLVALWRADRLTAETALYALAVTFALGAALAAWLLRARLSGSIELRSLRENWRFGKWLAAGEIGYWFSSHYYVYLGGVLLGSVASGVLKVGQTLLGPISVFLAFFVNYLPIVFARSTDPGGALKRSYRSVLPVVLLYCVFVAFFAEDLLVRVYGDAYGSYGAVVRLFALYYVLLGLSSPLVAFLAARRLTRPIFIGHAFGAAVSLAVGWILFETLGVEGGVVGMVLAWLASTVVLVRSWTTADHGGRPQGRGSERHSVRDRAPA